MPCPQDALSPSCTSAATIVSLLAEIESASFSHPSIGSLQQKLARMGQSPGGGGAKDKTSQEEKWRRRSMQANRQLFLKDTRKSKSEPGKGALPALMAFDEDGLEEEEEEEEEVVSRLAPAW